MPLVSAGSPPHLMLRQAYTLTNCPAAKQEANNNGTQTTALRQYVDARAFTSVRVTGFVETAGFAGTILAPQGSPDGGTTWYYLDGSADGAVPASAPQLAVQPGGGKVGAITAFAAVLRVRDLLVRFVSEGGNGVTDPFTGINVEFWG